MSPSKLNSILLTIGWVAVALNTLCILFALVSIRVLWKSFSCRSIIHRNLGFVLAAQSASILGSALSTAADNVVHLALQNPLYTDPWLAAGATFFNQFTVLVGHCLLLERVLATVMARYYEHWTSLKFTLSWATILTFICLYDGYSAYQTLAGNGNLMGSNLQTTLFTNIALLVISFVEIFLLWRLRLYNAAKYSMNAFYARQKPRLSERYQLSENVRTIRQLGPVFVGHFLECLVIATTVALQAYFSTGSSAATMLVIFPVCACLLALCNLGILFAVILFHPTQRRRMLHLMRPFLRFWGGHGNRVEDLFSSQRDQVMGMSVSFRNNHSEQKITFDEKTTKIGFNQNGNCVNSSSSESDFHFQMLAQQWR